MRTRPAIALALLLLSLTATAQNSGGGGMPMPVQPAGVTGFVTTVSGNLITLLNGNVTIDVSGAMFSKRKGAATIADVKPGLQIVALLKNPQAAPGTMLQAASVTILDVAAGSLYGPVQSVDVAGSTLTIFGALVHVTSDTRIYTFRGGRTPALSDIKPGDMVVTEVNVNGSALVAETIQVIPPMPNASLEGTVKSIGTTSWVITTRSGDVTVTVTAETKIDPAVKVGDKVYVIGSADPAGNMTALAIYAARPVPPPTTTPSLEGKVKSIGATAWVITTDDGKDVTVIVTANTKIDPSVNVGDAVLVIGSKDDSGNFVAIAIMKAPNKRRSAHA